MTTPRRPNKAALTIEIVESKSLDDGGCWIWQGALSSGTPAINIDRKTTQVRRWVAGVHLGLEIVGKFVTTKCLNRLCVCPECVIVVTRKKLQQMWSDHLKYSQSIPRRIKLSNAARARHNTDPALVEAVRIDQRPMRTIAKEIGKSFDFVYKIKSGATHANLVSPFAGLGARS